MGRLCALLAAFLIAACGADEGLEEDALRLETGQFTLGETNGLALRRPLAVGTRIRPTGVRDGVLLRLLGDPEFSPPESVVIDRSGARLIAPGLIAMQVEMRPPCIEPPCPNYVDGVVLDVREVHAVRTDHTLQTTALVNEAYLRLVEDDLHRETQALLERLLEVQREAIQARCTRATAEEVDVAVRPGVAAGTASEQVHRGRLLAGLGERFGHRPRDLADRHHGSVPR